MKMCCTKLPQSKSHHCDGYALLSVVALIAALLVSAAATIQLTRTELHSTADHVARQQALYVAEAGVETALARLNWERDIASSYTTYSRSASDQSFSNGTFDYTISQDSIFPSDPTRKLIQATGYVYRQQARVTAHAVVQPISSSNSAPTPTYGVPATPTPGAPSTPTPTPTGNSPYSRPCSDHEILASYNGTARWINTIGALSQQALAGPSAGVKGQIFSNGNSEFQLDASVANDASVNVRTRGNFVNGGLGIGVLSNFANSNLYRVGSYQKALLDPVTHLLGTCTALTCIGAHFGNGSSPNTGHGVVQAVPTRSQWQPDYKKLKQQATYIVNKDYQPFGSWDTATKTWVVTGDRQCAAGSNDSYYVEGNVSWQGIHLMRTASAWIVARGWMSIESVNVLATGLGAGDTQHLSLIAEKDLMIGRSVIDMSVPTFRPAASALTLSVGIGMNLAAVLHRLNVFAYSQRGEVWGMTSNLSAFSDMRACFLAKSDSTLATTGTLASTIRSLY